MASQILTLNRLGVRAVEGLNETLKRRLVLPNGSRGTAINEHLHEEIAQALNERMAGMPALRDQAVATSDVTRKGSTVKSFDGEQKSVDVLVKLNGAPVLAYFDKMPGQNVLQNKGNYVSDLHGMVEALTENTPGLLVSMCHFMPAVAPYFDRHGTIVKWENPGALIGPERLASLVATARRNGGEFLWNQIPYHLDPTLQHATTKSQYQQRVQGLIRRTGRVLDEAHRATLEKRVNAALRSMVQHLKSEATARAQRSSIRSRCYVPGSSRSTLMVA